MQQSVPASQLSSNTFGIHGGGRAARAASEFAASVDQQVDLLPRVPLITDGALRRSRLNDQFSLVAAQAAVGPLSQPAAGPSMLKTVGDSLYDGGLMMLNGATLGLVPTFNSENARLRAEYGEGVFWTCNIAGGIAALALTAAGAVFTEGGARCCR